MDLHTIKTATERPACGLSKFLYQSLDFFYREDARYLSGKRAGGRRGRNRLDSSKRSGSLSTGMSELDKNFSPMSMGDFGESAKGWDE
jgi:hypothetical protein